MESLIELLLEVFFQLLGDLVVDAVSRSRSPVVHTAANSVLVIILAGLLAALSLAVHPEHIIRDSTVRAAALLTIPILNGAVMVFVGRRLIQRGRIRSSFEHFIPAFLFSLVFGAIRFLGGR